MFASDSKNDSNQATGKTAGGKRPTALRRLRELVQNTRGAEMVEMIVIVAIVISLVYAGMRIFGSQVSAALSKQGSAVSQIGGGGK